MNDVLTEDQFNTFRDLFKFIYKEDANAIRLSFKILRIAHTWDDLIDGDKSVTPEQISKAFVSATIDLTLNPLWGEDLAYNLINIYIKWLDANQIESSEGACTNDNLALAWNLRAGLYDIFVLIALKLYGLDWACEISMQTRLTYGETLEDYMKEFEKCLIQ